ncbi:hypothetical protein SAMN06297251_102149 [Fulvimarina manganoxydans]|uniref:Uncharacterized protein n=1 Tax=Fulvimarina manganoxydans TaxID=937218 RepID=A0A1W1Z5Q4_9HYPH|nr:hypothetical protein [Fulvimarina manganoxydans]SMC43268.1 hypothetical protein SAMN06297251_102149 [Fulvimarina manganoxydans]
MIAAIGRYLHQPIDQVEEWEVEKFLAYYDRAQELLKMENPESD